MLLCSYHRNLKNFRACVVSMPFLLRRCVVFIILRIRGVVNGFFVILLKNQEANYERRAKENLQFNGN